MGNTHSSRSSAIQEGLQEMRLRNGGESSTAKETRCHNVLLGDESMSVDIVGPFPRVRDLASGKDVVKYVMVATALVPDYVTKPHGEDERRAEDLQEPESKDIVMPIDDIPEKGRPKILEPSWGDGPEEEDFPLGVEEHSSPETQEKSEAPKGEKDDPDRMTGEEVKRLVEECKQPFNVRHVTMVELLNSRHVSEILVGLGKCIAKFNTMGIKINRLHSDRAKEFLSKKVERWCSEKLIRQTMTSGDDPASNGHVESEVNQLKRRTRLYLRVAGSAISDWPQAMRYCAEERMRQQLEKLPCCLSGQKSGFGQKDGSKRGRFRLHMWKDVCWDPVQ